jgi:hypothetical protein
MRILSFFLFLFLFVFLYSSCQKEGDFYREIKDLKHPTTKDYQTIQKHLKKDQRKYLKHCSESCRSGGMLFDYGKKSKKFRLIGETLDELPSSGKIFYNCTEEDRECCIICYASFNQNYPKGIDRIQKALKHIGFKGHFFYKKGGWPNLEGEALTLAHIPYAFKPCFFREVKNLGYKYVLWLDSSMAPLKSLDPIFQKVKEKGYFGYKASCFKMIQYANPYILRIFHVSEDEAEHIPTIETGVIGLDFSSTIGNLLLDKWEEAARSGGFFSSRPEQNSFSIIAYQLHLEDFDDALPTRPWERKNLSDEALLLVDYSMEYQPF